MCTFVALDHNDGAAKPPRMAKLKLKLPPDLVTAKRYGRSQELGRHGNDGSEIGLEDERKYSTDWSLIPDDPFAPAEPVQAVLKDGRMSGDSNEEYREEERSKTRMSDWGRVVLPPSLESGNRTMSSLSGKLVLSQRLLRELEVGERDGERPGRRRGSVSGL
jgi:hypothetical protein